MRILLTVLALIPTLGAGKVASVSTLISENTAVAPGMVFTIEPGIYIQAEKLGVRLENDYLIGETENINLMATIPIEADEIEALMA